MEKQSFSVEGMSCASCASSVESLLGANEEIKEALVNFASSTLSVTYKTNALPLEKLNEILEPAGFKLVQDISLSLEEDELQHAKLVRKIFFNLIGSAIFSIPLFVLSMFFHHVHSLYWLQLVLCLPVLWFGRQFYIIGFRRILIGKATMDTLIALGTGSAFVFSLFNVLFPQILESRGMQPQVYFESAAIIITFILLGRYLEARAKFSTSASIRKLLSIQAKTATLIVNNEEKEVAIESIVPGDLLLVKPGSKVPTDGVIESGSSFVDESMISGESIPVEKAKGDKVIGSTLNTTGAFVMKASRVGADTVLSQIIKQVKDAQGSKAPVQALTDKIASIFVPVVLALAAITFVAWYILASENNLLLAFNAMFAVLVIACPCALGLATPTAIIAGIGKAAEHGILIKDAAGLEKVGKINALAIDKTGTITTGIQSVNYAFPNLSEIQPDIRQAIFSIESLSEHPIAQAVKKHFTQESMLNVDNFENIPGFGIKARIQNDDYIIGNERFIKAENIEIEAFYSEKLLLLQADNQSIVFVSKNREIVQILGISDKIKDSSALAVKKLQAQGITVHLLSGDNARIVAHVAMQTGISAYKAEMLPGMKAEYIKNLQQQGLRVAMAGDGINDSPALAQADVGFAMESGAEVAVQTAQIVLLHGDISKIEQAIEFSKKTVRVIHQNLFWAFFYNIMSIPIAAGLLYPIWGIQLNPMLAGAAMAFSSVSVVTNSLRLRYMLR